MPWKIFLLELLLLILFERSMGQEDADESPKPLPMQWRYASCECGLERSSGIIPVVTNGDIVKPGHRYPWMVQLFHNMKHSCGGSMITRYFILTAAHCVAQPKEIAPVGFTDCKPFYHGEVYCVMSESYLSVKLPRHYAGMGEPVYIESIIVNDMFDLKTHNFDIALLKTQSMLPCDIYTGSICLPNTIDMYMVGKAVTLAGWGVTKEGKLEADPGPLREAHMKINDPRSCSRRFLPTHFCALGKGQNACYGDSGGPLFTEVDDKYYIVGISSHGFSATCSATSPEFYTTVINSLEWINSNVCC